MQGNIIIIIIIMIIFVVGIIIIAVIINDRTPHHQIVVVIITCTWRQQQIQTPVSSSLSLSLFSFTNANNINTFNLFTGFIDCCVVRVKWWRHRHPRRRRRDFCYKRRLFRWWHRVGHLWPCLYRTQVCTQ